MGPFFLKVGKKLRYSFARIVLLRYIVTVLGGYKRFFST